MGGLIRRLLGTLAAMLLGALVGMAVGAAWQAWTAGAVLGAAVGVLTASVGEASRARRFMRWVRADASRAAPRGAGFWGEIGYRVEVSCARASVRRPPSATRLQQFLPAIEASPNGVLLLDATDHVVWCNTVAADHFGLDPERNSSSASPISGARRPSWRTCMWDSSIRR